MNYIYDIALNFQKYFCEFFEWKRSDKITTIRKVPIYRISSKDIIILKYNEVILNDKFMQILKKDLGNINKNICLVSDGNIAIGLLLSNTGKLLKRSSLLYDEEDEVCSYAMEFDIQNIEYLKNKRIKYNDELRICRERKKILHDYLSKITDIMVWKYLYYECFNTDCEDIQKIKKDLLRIANLGYGELNNKLYESIMLFSKIKN